MKYFKQNKHLYEIAFREKTLIGRHYDCFTNVSIANNTLTCTGWIQPTELSIKYKIKIIYKPDSKPKVFVKEPDIEHNDEIHMYPDKSLCLYYPKEMPWHNSMHLTHTIIPWTVEWLIFYELYQIQGVWRHPSVPHKIGEKKE